MTLKHSYFIIAGLALLTAYLFYSNSRLTSEVAKLSGTEE